MEELKEQNTQTVELEDGVTFDGKIVKKIKFDLIHINQGWDEAKHDYYPAGVVRSTNMTADDVVEYFEQFEYFQPEWELGNNKIEITIRGNKYFRYVAIVFDYEDNNKSKKIVIDIPKIFNGEGIIVTIH